MDDVNSKAVLVLVKVEKYCCAPNYYHPSLIVTIGYCVAMVCETEELEMILMVYHRSLVIVRHHMVSPWKSTDTTRIYTMQLLAMHAIVKRYSLHCGDCNQSTISIILIIHTLC